jgi:hypothetical protein
MIAPIMDSNLMIATWVPLWMGVDSGAAAMIILLSQ